MQGIEQDQVLLLLFMFLYYHNALPRSGNLDLVPDVTTKVGYYFTK